MQAAEININKRVGKVLLLLLLACMAVRSFAQINPTDSLPDDPAAISVNTVQQMNFGAFTGGSTGGALTLSTSGSRSATGSIVPLNLGRPYFPAMFDVSAPQGSVIAILFGPDVLLTGSNGGSMSMHISGSDPPSPFIVVVNQPVRTQVKVGGILSVGSPAANPPGAYSGTFYVTFHHE